MATAMTGPPSRLAILRRVVERKHTTLSPEAAKAILQLDFDAADRRRMNQLAAKNRAGQLTPAEDEELSNFIHVGQVLGILKSKARKALQKGGPRTRKP